eukprot:CAMPEP_0206377232 /NCGR_PEP_ID=MMETSP0294-20121207/10024_1 /ASSEMBLY_ACC=CAM_ASM_000327 /TAXON_ID=39354 /ORGANISM="Heterosigma akashiwo, Strain CCMP2393" /LENGTH=111 /DNA_ID=CAMNT_0053825647 /DNA_START=518 /DNA_END=853 /DNA_ORIENTATION=+
MPPGGRRIHFLNQADSLLPRGRHVPGRAGGVDGEGGGQQRPAASTLIRVHHVEAEPVGTHEELQVALAPALGLALGQLEGDPLQVEVLREPAELQAGHQREGQRPGRQGHQ